MDWPPVLFMKLANCFELYVHPCLYFLFSFILTSCALFFCCYKACENIFRQRGFELCIAYASPNFFCPVTHFVCIFSYLRFDYERVYNISKCKISQNSQFYQIFKFCAYKAICFCYLSTIQQHMYNLPMTIPIKIFFFNL